MRVFALLTSLAVGLSTVSCQGTVKYCDPLTSICYSSYTTPAQSNTPTFNYRVAIPNVSAAPFDAILQIVAPVSAGWAGFSWTGRMVYSPLLVTWANGQNAVGSQRYTYGYSLPATSSLVQYDYLKGTGVNSTHWTVTVVCSGCSQFDNPDGSRGALNPSSSDLMANVFGWAYSKTKPADPSNNASSFGVHDTTGKWGHDLTIAKNANFDALVRSNLLNPPTSSAPVSSSTSSSTPVSTSSIPVTTSSRSSSASSSLSSSAPPSISSTVPVCSQTGIAPAAPSACPGVAANSYPIQVASGWTATKIAGPVTLPRGIITDSAGNLLVVLQGVGVAAYTLGTNGCVASSKTLIPQANLNHGIALSADGKTLYASALGFVYSWSYNPSTVTVSGSSTTIIKGMNPGGHPSRTLLIPATNPNIMAVQVGSNENIDAASVNIATQRAVIKVFDLTKVPSGGYNFVTDGWQMGYGLRNEVGMTVDGNGMLWGVENSSDDMNRVVNGQSTDIHTDNPAEELNYLGDPSKPNPQWYGYPTCFTVWDPSVIRDKTFQTGDQLVTTPNSTFTDTNCNGQSKPPRLGFQAHSAPLDAKFDSSFSNLYVTLHGSWDRQPPTGFKLIAVPFTRLADGSYDPVAPATSRTGYTDVLWNSDVTRCGTSYCARPVGLVWDSYGRLFMTSDASGGGEIFMLTNPKYTNGGGTAPSSCIPQSSSTSSVRPSSSTSSSTSSMITTTFRPSTTSTTSRPPPSSTAAVGTVAHYGQCGGQGWTGGTVCIDSWPCKCQNTYYCQCVPP